MQCLHSHTVHEVRARLWILLPPVVAAVAAESVLGVVEVVEVMPAAAAAAAAAVMAALASVAARLVSARRLSAALANS